ncbi:MAG: hypothetical protein Q8L79_00885 [Methylobacter sp.]|uniref:NMCC_0638 family (lipo)protein n=1 Tax=Methylobacter sp. TaxID=2051955 RepID=UPI00272FC48B|nr:hypothetical protein [Methylobacter sp.]MDP1663651.1 hypothetical protein [Methylobacter sp.]
MRASIILILLFVAISNTCIASDADNQAESFANIYVSLCMKNLSDLEGLRVKLKNMPKLPPEKTVQFLSGSPGDAWPVHDKYGAFVLALPNNKNICMVYARRADTGKAEKMFIGLVGSPLAPFVSRLAKDERAQTGGNGPTHTISYEWSVPNAARKMLFTLTTANSDNAQLQALGSAAIIGN